MEELKPCICGNEDINIFSNANNGKRSFTANCIKCKKHTRDYCNENHAVLAWNKLVGRTNKVPAQFPYPDIEFRGVRKDNYELIYGSLMRDNKNKWYILSEDFTMNVSRDNIIRPNLELGIEDVGISDVYDAAWYGYESALNRFEECFPELVEVNPYKISMFTGLRDKNGIKIFEGDLINRVTTNNGDEDSAYYQVVFIDGCFMLQFIETFCEGAKIYLHKDYNIAIGTGGYYDVIGNVYERW